MSIKLQMLGGGRAGGRRLRVAGLSGGIDFSFHVARGNPALLEGVCPPFRAEKEGLPFAQGPRPLGGALLATWHGGIPGNSSKTLGRG